MTIVTCATQGLDPYFTLLVVFNMNYNSMWARRVTALPYITKDRRAPMSKPAIQKQQWFQLDFKVVKHFHVLAGDEKEACLA